MKTSVTDHLGNKFETVTEMCKYWGISKNLYYQRIKYGWSLEKNLTNNKNILKRKCKDHLGNEFNSVKDMCDYYGIKTVTYTRRINVYNWSVEDALTKKVKSYSSDVTDHLGNKFDSVSEMCKYWKIKYNIYNSRISRNWSIERALITSCKSVFDHLGKEFESIEKMCNYYRITSRAYKARVKRGWSKEKALTVPLEGANTYDHLGNKFNSVSEMCRYYNINKATYNSRIKNKATIEEALGAIPYLSKIANNIEFDNITVISFAYKAEDELYFKCKYEEKTAILSKSAILNIISNEKKN